MRAPNSFLIACILLAMAFAGKAQVWPAPGATWNYSVQGVIPGYGWYKANLTVTAGDTIQFGGKACIPIGGSYNQIYEGNIPYAVPQGDGLITYFDNQVVYYYNSRGQRFDTLIDYKANIGTLGIFQVGTVSAYSFPYRNLIQ